MLPARTRKPPTFGHLLALLCLVVSGWLNSPMVQAADILLTGIEGSPGVQSFTQALRELRPGDNVRFQPVAELPPPGELHGDIRLILLAPARYPRPTDAGAAHQPTASTATTG
jgi:hypothetical protein